MANAKKIRDLIAGFENGDPIAEQSFRALADIGSPTIPYLIDALNEGMPKRWYAARTLGEIAVNASCGLLSLDETARKSALKATERVLEDESARPGTPESDQVIYQLRRAVFNLSKCRPASAISQESRNARPWWKLW
jgi:hypothetical protein